MTNTILIIDDNDDDIFALRRALKKAGVANPQQVVKNGQQAMEYLSGAGKFADREAFPLPVLAFIDLKMPFMDGFELLTWIRTQPALASIVLVVLTGSDEVRDHQRAYSLGARSYLVKPPSSVDLQNLIHSLESLWLRQGGNPLVSVPA